MERSPKSGYAAGRQDSGSARPEADTPARRILIAEDEFLVSVLLEQDMTEAGYRVIGPYTRFSEAMNGVRQGGFELALLDINMNGHMAYPLADALLAQGVPFIFLSGYGAQDMPERFRACPRISKPYNLSVLLREIARLIGRPPNAAQGPD